MKGVLLRETDKIINYIEKYVTLVSPERQEEVLALFENMNQFFPQWVVATCPVMHPDIYYASKNIAVLFGYSNDYILKSSAIEKYFRHVHDADQQDRTNVFLFCMILSQLYRRRSIIFIALCFIIVLKKEMDNTCICMMKRHR